MKVEELRVAHLHHALLVVDCDTTHRELGESRSGSVESATDREKAQLLRPHESTSKSQTQRPRMHSVQIPRLPSSPQLRAQSPPSRRLLQ
eukprot:984431-Rhodomonas_salina.1